MVTVGEDLNVTAMEMAEALFLDDNAGPRFGGIDHAEDRWRGMSERSRQPWVKRAARLLALLHGVERNA